MARRKKHEEHENHERWLVSYADFITLLFAFFVVMYSVSSVNEGKYRTLSHSMMAAFHGPQRSLEPIQVGALARTPRQAPLEISQTPQNIVLPQHMIRKDDVFSRLKLVPKRPETGGKPGGDASKPKDAGGKGSGPDQAKPEPSREDQAHLDSIGAQIVSALGTLIDEKLVTVRRTRYYLEVALNTSILFPSGSAEFVQPAGAILKRVAAILKPFPNPIRVEGYTDNVPINTPRFHSNWELSAARAVRVVRLLQSESVDPERMAAMGYGEHRPIADNSTPEGRAKNRRVTLVILAAPDGGELAHLVHPPVSSPQAHPAAVPAGVPAPGTADSGGGPSTPAGTPAGPAESAGIARASGAGGAASP